MWRRRALELCRWNAPPGWPRPPVDWKPGPGWTPDPAWDPAPADWQYWVPLEHDPPRGPRLLRPLVRVLSRRLPYGLLVLFLAMSLGVPALARWSFGEFAGDPDGVYIDDLHHDVDPPAFIAVACPASVAKVGHLDNPTVFLGGVWFQRWKVTPMPGHVDRVLLNTTTGQVVCP